MIALADGRLIPHGKHANLHRRAIIAMEGKPPRTLRVKMGAVSHEGRTRPSRNYLGRTQGGQRRGGK
eukprot:13983401-Heterocapsa_arctica.AAC.1